MQTFRDSEPGKMLLSQKINTRSDAGPHRKSDCERATLATQRMRGGGLAASCCTRARGQLSACGVASCCAAVRCAVCAC